MSNDEEAAPADPVARESSAPSAGVIASPDATTVSSNPVVPPMATSGALALGSLAIGALAVGSLAIGALAIGRLAIRRARIRALRVDRLEIGELVVRRRVDA